MKLLAGILIVLVLAGCARSGDRYWAGVAGGVKERTDR